MRASGTTKPRLHSLSLDPSPLPYIPLYQHCCTLQTTHHRQPPQQPPSCTAHTPCASRALPPPRRSRTHRLPPPPPRAADSLARPTLVRSITCAESAMSTWANCNIHRPQLPQVRPPRCLRPRPCEEALPAREDGEERHALHGAGRSRAYGGCCKSRTIFRRMRTQLTSIPATTFHLGRGSR